MKSSALEAVFKKEMSRSLGAVSWCAMPCLAQYLEEALEAAEAAYDSGDKLEGEEGGEQESTEEEGSTGEGESSSEGESTEEEEQWEEAAREVEEEAASRKGGSADLRHDGSSAGVCAEQRLSELQLREEEDQRGSCESHPGDVQPLEAQSTPSGLHQSAQDSTEQALERAFGSSESGSEGESVGARVHAPNVDRRSLRKERARAVSSVKPGNVGAKVSRNATKDKGGKRSRHIRSAAKGDY